MAKQFECPQDDCQFMIRANEENEIVSHVRDHAQDKHGMSMDRGDIMNAMQDA